MGFLSRIQEKNSDTKTWYAFFGATVVTGLIALVWVSTLPARFSGGISLDAKDTEALDMLDESTEEIGSVVSDTKSQLGNLIQGMREESQQIMEGENTALDTMVTDEVAVPGMATESESVPFAPEPAPIVEKEEEAPLPTPEPRVILIGTTTSQKSQ